MVDFNSVIDDCVFGQVVRQKEAWPDVHHEKYECHEKGAGSENVTSVINTNGDKKTTSNDGSEDRSKSLTHGEEA